MKALKWMASNILGMLGGIFLGFSIPTHINIMGDICPDFVIFLPLSVICVGISYYYTFVDKSWKDV